MPVKLSEESSPFKLGDVVQILSGGPNMTVMNCYVEDCGTVCASTVWFTSEGQLGTHGFDIRLIRLAGTKLN